MHKLFFIALTALSLLTACSDHSGHGTDHAPPKDAVVHKHQGLELISARLRETPPKAPTAAGYLSIKNTGDKDDVLTGGSATFAQLLEVHTMKMDNDVMKMRKLEDGLPVSAGETVMLKPGADHLMFIGLKKSLKAGDTETITLSFKNAGDIELQVPVVKIDTSGSGAHSGH